MGLHVAGKTRIGVDPPRPADAVLAVEDREVAKAPFSQEDPSARPPGPAPMIPTERFRLSRFAGIALRPRRARSR